MREAATRAGAAWPLWIGLALAAWVVATAAGLAGDANWDLRNYHLYNAFALFDPAAAGDLAPAQLQSFYPPTLDIPYHWLVRHVGAVPWLNALLALPHAAVAVLAFLVTAQVLRAHDPAGWTLAGLAAAYGVTGAAAWPTLATTMDDAVAVAMVLAGVLVLVRGGWTVGRCFAAGLLCGLAAGLKLTTSYAGTGLGCALVAAGGGRLRDRAVRGGAFSAGAVAGAMATGGWWWWHLYAGTGNPLFPYMNGLFRSPLLPPANFADTRFLPHTALEWLAYPFHWAATAFHGASELDVRDPRFALASVATLVLGVQAVLRRDRRAGLLAVFMAASYVLWLSQFGILRYLSCLEPLTGTVAAACALPLLRTVRARLATLAAGAALLAATLAVTLYPDWGHAPRCDGMAACPPIAVGFPPIGPDSLVMILDWGPTAYLRPFAPPSSRWVGAHSNLVGLNPAEPLQQRVRQALDTARAEVWGLENAGEAPGIADGTLAFYRLHRTGCAPVRSNLDDSRIQLCRLVRD